MLRVTDAAGETLAESEITNTEDGEVSVEAKSDGIHFLEVRELADQFGKPLVYRVSAEKVRSGFSLTIAEHAFSAKAGQPVSIKVTAKRTKYEGVIQLQVTGGAADLKLEAAIIGKCKNETTLKLTLPADAKPGMVLAFTVTGRGENGSEAVAHQTNESLLKQFRLMNQFPPELQTQLHAVAVE